MEGFSSLKFLGSQIGGVGYEDTSGTGETRPTFANLRHLWLRRDIRFSPKGRVYHAIMFIVLMVVKSALSVFDHQCLRSIAGVWWVHWMCSDEVR